MIMTIDSRLNLEAVLNPIIVTREKRSVSEGMQDICKPGLCRWNTKELLETVSYQARPWQVQVSSAFPLDRHIRSIFDTGWEDFRRPKHVMNGQAWLNRAEKEETALLWMAMECFPRVIHHSGQNLPWWPSIPALFDAQWPEANRVVV